MPCKTLKEAIDYALFKAKETRTQWFVNRLASSGVMRYSVDRKPITDTSFGGGMVYQVTPNGDLLG